MELGDPDADRPSENFELEPERTARGFQLFAVLAVLLLAGTAAFLMWRRQPSAVTETSKAAATDTKIEERGALGPDVPAVEVPALDLSDAFVRQLLGSLSSRPELAAWLATDHLIRGFVASVDNVASGPTPAPHLRALAPVQTFQVMTAGRYTFVDPQSYKRYDGIADAVQTLDPDGLSKAYVTLKPRLQEAYRDLGHPDGNIDGAVETAIVRLLEVPVVESNVRVKEAGGIAYEYVDDRLEALSPAQKQLLRMGPRNVKLVQDKLRAAARALQIPADRLP